MQTKRKKELFFQDKKDEKEFVEYWNEKMKYLVFIQIYLQEESEKLEKVEIKERNLNLQNFLKFQMTQKKSKAEEEFIKDQENAYKTKGLIFN